MWLFHFLAASLFPHLPLQFRNAACRPAATHETNWRIAHLDLIWDVKNLDLGIEFFRLTESRVLLVNHHIPRTWHVVFVETLDVQTHIVTWIGKIHALVMHLYCEDLASARIGGRVCWQKDNLFSWFHHTLFDTTCKHIADTLDFVNSRNWHTHWCTHGSLWDAAHFV